MTDRNFWVRPAMIEEGSFCDRTSELHYDHLSAAETEEAIAGAEARGEEVADFRDIGAGENLANNCTTMNIDRHGHEYPTKLEPGN